MKSAIITLIHGTFARDATWTSENSSFCTSIADSVDADIRFERFIWSGRNNLDHRHYAAEALALFLAEQRQQHPTASQIVMGHSHGGSVLAYALARYPDSMASLSGAVFLATPFIDARARRDWRLTAAVSTVFLLLLFHVAATLLFFKIVTSVDDSNPSLLFDIYTGYYFGIIALAVHFAGPHAFSSYDAKQLADDVSTCRLPNGHYLFLRATGDEASTTLSALQFSSWLFSKIVSIAFKPLSPLSRMPILAKIFVFFSFAVLPGAFLSMVAYPTWLYDASWQPWYLILLSGSIVFIAAVAFSALWITCLFICWICHRTFGRASLRASICLELVVEALPIGSHVLIHTPWPDSLDDLSHSSPYQSREAIREIRSWLIAIMARDTAQRSRVVT